jgi:hypothetical protein
MTAPMHPRESATARSLRAAAMRFVLPIVLVACDPMPDWHIGESVEIRVNVAVGETASVDVTDLNSAERWSCDPSALVEAKLEARHGNRSWSVTGVESGITRCRLGNVHNDHVNVTVTIAPRRP